MHHTDSMIRQLKYNIRREQSLQGCLYATIIHLLFCWMDRFAEITENGYYNVDKSEIYIFRFQAEC